jgi:hypothetical protein
VTNPAGRFCKEFLDQHPVVSVGPLALCFPTVHTYDDHATSVPVVFVVFRFWNHAQMLAELLITAVRNKHATFG